MLCMLWVLHTKYAMQFDYKNTSERPQKYNYSGVSVITEQTFQDKSMVPEEFFTKEHYEIYMLNSANYFQ